MPPPGVPTFTPRQLKEYYSRRNILVIGDSTSRRMYTTLHKVMNAANLEDMTITDVDGDPWKRRNFCGEDMGDRYISTLRLPLCLNHTYITEIRDVYRNETIREDFKFDNTGAVCYSELEKKWEDEAFLTGIAKEYDLIIIAMGIWEQVRARDCRSANTTTDGRLQTSLEAMERTNPPGLQLVFRNSAFDKRYESNNVIRNANAVADQFFHDLDQKWEMGRYERNMTLVDWGGGMESRSYGENRIEGDLKPHYGLEARLLAIQQITHELLKSDLITRDVKRMREDQGIF